MAIAHNLLHRPPRTAGIDLRGLSWSAVEARVLRRRWFRRILPMAWMPVLAGLGLAGAVTLALRGDARSATWGAIGVSVVWVQLAVLVAWSGAGNLVIGRQAEASTAQVLRGMRRHGWNVLHNASVGRGRGIDHVVVGPAGVLVVETKWRRDLTPDDLAWAAHQVRRSHHDVAGILRADHSALPVLPLVVAWGPTEPDALPAAVDGVPVVHGDRLAAWLEGLPAAGVETAEVDGAWQLLRNEVTASF